MLVADLTGTFLRLSCNANVIFKYFRLLLCWPSDKDHAIADMVEFVALTEKMVVLDKGYKVLSPSSKNSETAAYLTTGIEAHNVTRKITPPRTDVNFPRGRVTLICSGRDKDQAFAVFPYRFRNIPVCKIVEYLYPDIIFEILPDYDSADYHNHKAEKQALERAKKLSGYGRCVVRQEDDTIFVYGIENGCLVGVKKFQMKNLKNVSSF